MTIKYIFVADSQYSDAKTDGYIIGCRISNIILISLLCVPISKVKEDKLYSKLISLKNDELIKNIIGFEVDFELIGRIENNEVKYNIFRPEETTIAYYPVLLEHYEYNISHSKELTVNQKLLQIVRICILIIL